MTFNSRLFNYLPIGNFGRQSSNRIICRSSRSDNVLGRSGRDLNLPSRRNEVLNKVYLTVLGAKVAALLIFATDTPRRLFRPKALVGMESALDYAYDLKKLKREDYVAWLNDRAKMVGLWGENAKNVKFRKMTETLAI